MDDDNLEPEGDELTHEGVSRVQYEQWHSPSRRTGPGSLSRFETCHRKDMLMSAA